MPTEHFCFPSYITVTFIHLSLKHLEAITTLLLGFVIPNIIVSIYHISINLFILQICNIAWFSFSVTWFWCLTLCSLFLFLLTHLYLIHFYFVLHRSHLMKLPKFIYQFSSCYHFILVPFKPWTMLLWTFPWRSSYVI